MYDVAVLGAGPGGSTIARYLAKMGFSVCLIDKDEFPRDKPCGGGFSSSIFNDFPYLQSVQEEMLHETCRVGVLHSPNRQTTFRASIEMAVGLRTEFDNALFKKAQELGVETVLGKKARRVDVAEENVNVTLQHGYKVKAKFLVGADGVTSLVARTLNLNRSWPKKDITVCRVAEVPVSSDMIKSYYGDDLEYHFFTNVGGMPGYGWIFPKRSSVNVGLGIVGHKASGLPRYFANFTNFLGKYGYIPSASDISGARGALVPTGGPIKKTYSNRVILVGDSAGMVNPITGGGIVFAMRAVRIGACVLNDALETDQHDDRILSRYQQLWMKNFGY